jgi:hypothetical protein
MMTAGRRAAAGGPPPLPTKNAASISDIPSGLALQRATGQAERGVAPGPGEIVRHVQRIERRQRFERRQQRGRDHLGRDMVGAAMHDAVADGGEPLATQMGVDERQQGVEDGGKRIRAACRPASFGQHRADGIASRSSISPRTVACNPAAMSNRANFKLDEPAFSVRIDTVWLIGSSDAGHQHPPVPRRWRSRSHGQPTPARASLAGDSRPVPAGPAYLPGARILSQASAS